MTLLLLLILTQSCETREDEVRGNEEREEGGERGEGSGDGAADYPPSRTATNDSCPHLQALTKQETDATTDTAIEHNSPPYGEHLKAIMYATLGA